MDAGLIFISTKTEQKLYSNSFQTQVKRKKQNSWVSWFYATLKHLNLC